MVSFYCTRCRKLTSFSEELVGEIVSCPFCRQALIVPDLRPYEKKDVVPPKVARTVETPPPTTKTPSVATEEKPVEEVVSRSTLSHGVLVHSHLFSDKSRRIDVGRSIRLNWTSLAEESGMDEETSLDPERTFVASRDLSDDEFIRRLNSAPVRSTASPQVVSPPVRRTTVESYEGDEPNYAVKIRRLYIALSLLVALLVVVGSVTLVSKLACKTDVVPTLVGVEPISVEGVVTYRNASGKFEGDEGAFVFLLPANGSFATPLTTSGANPNVPLPRDFDEFLLELGKNGGYFVEAGFDGLFSIDVKTPGEYWTLVVSKNAEGAPDSIGEKELREIEKYLFLPKRLFPRTKATWTKRAFDDSNRQLEVEFGKTTIVR